MDRGAFFVSFFRHFWAFWLLLICPVPFPYKLITKKFVAPESGLFLLFNKTHDLIIASCIFFPGGNIDQNPGF